VAVIGATAAGRLFGSDAAAIGKNVRFGADAFRVVGVVDDVPLVRTSPFADVWVPIGSHLTPEVRDDLLGGIWTLLVLNDDARREEVEAAFNARLREVPVREVNGSNVVRAQLETFFESTTGELFGDEGVEEKALFYAILGLVGLLFLAIPALNLINLNLSRTMERASEIGVRKAFGARPASLTALFLVEHTLLCLIGSGLGLGVAYGLLNVLAGMDVLPYTRFILSFPLFGTAVVAALVLSVLSGVYPAWRMARLHPVEALRRR
jgi:putative ABC transport system permease protein